MVLPLSRLAVRAGNALAGTVAGMVTTQNTPKPTTAATTARTTSLRSIGNSLPCPTIRNAGRAKKLRGGASSRLAAPAAYSRDISDLGRLLPIGIVAATAILADIAHRRLEAV